ncbi:hypothetical protein Tco_1149443 [Tanacetum coccineum]
MRLPFCCTPPAVADIVISDPTSKDITIGTSSAKVLAKVDSLKKRKVLISGDASSHVVKRTRSVVFQSSGSTTRPSLFSAGSDRESEDDEDACVEIPLITLV